MPIKGMAEKTVLAAMPAEVVLMKLRLSMGVVSMVLNLKDKNYKNLTVVANNS
jgi:hypothetical protein